MAEQRAIPLMLKHRQLIANAQGGNKTVAKHYAMFKVAMAEDAANMTGLEVITGLGIEGTSYASEYNKMRNLVSMLRQDGTLLS